MGSMYKNRFRVTVNITSLFFVLSGFVTSLATAGASIDSQCLASIDLAVERYQSGSATEARQQHNLLRGSCEHLPQLWHNMGVLAVDQKDWNLAIGYFEKSLSLDTRAFATVDTLRSLLQFQAALAYRTALGHQQRTSPRLPVAKMQTSSLRNAYQAQEPSDPQLVNCQANWNESAQPGLHIPGANRVREPDDSLQVRRTVLRWWNSRVDPGEIAENGERLEFSHVPEWQEINITLEFTDADAVAVVTPPASSGFSASLLLLRETGDGWEIYTERAL